MHRRPRRVHSRHERIHLRVHRQSRQRSFRPERVQRTELCRPTIGLGNYATAIHLTLTSYLSVVLATRIGEFPLDEGP